MTQGIRLSDLKKQGNKYLYLGKLYIPNQPVKSTAKGKKFMVLATKIVNRQKRIRLIHFGGNCFNKNSNKIIKNSYLKRSAHIRNKQGKLTRNDPWSANFWARKLLNSDKQLQAAKRHTAKNIYQSRRRAA